MKKNHVIDNVFTLVLFAMFATMALLVTSAGASAYKSTSEQTEKRFDRQTCLSYITARVRSNNEAGAVEITELGGCEALTFTQEANGGKYITCIYYQDGAIRELLFREGIELAPEDGTAICSANGLSFSLEGGSLAVTLTGTDGAEVTAVINCVG